MRSAAATSEPALPPPVALSIAGSDNSAGAGIQADLKTYGALGCYGLTAVTCVVAEVPGKVSRIQAIRPEMVAEQVRLSFEAFPVAAVKTGMLYSTAIIEAVAAELAKRAHGPARRRSAPLVVDPVMVATSGDPLLRRSAVEAYKRLLFPLATILTPNLDELAVLAGRNIDTIDAMRSAAREIADRFGCAVLAKGGHLRGATATDLLLADGAEHSFEAPFRRGVSTHGTGCTYAAAIAAGLAAGAGLPAAVQAAKEYVTGAIHGAFRWGSTHALDHRVPAHAASRRLRASRRER